MTKAMSEWARCRSWIEAALEHGFGYSIEDIEAEIEAGEAQFWPGNRSAMVTQFWTFPKAKTLNLWLAGGELQELVEILRPQAEAWAKAHGCTHIIIAGRAGWVRALKDKGYAPVWTALAKELEHGNR